jgi:hypothetical protein
LRTGAFALALAGSVGISAAQQPPPPADTQQRSQQDNAQQTPSGKTGKEEPSSHAATAQPQENAVFVNGALTVPDAPARVPQTKDYSYAVTHDRVLLVGTSRVVAGVFADANVPVSQGRRGP